VNNLNFKTGRYELKFFVPLHRLDALVRYVRPYVEPDPHAKLDQHGLPRYTIQSVYLDTERLRFYHEKQDGVMNRRKFRVRIYGSPSDASRAFLEIKFRDNTQVSKDRIAVPLSDARRIFAHLAAPELPGLSPPQARMLVRYLAAYDTLALRPVVNVMYDRTAFVGRTDDTVRFTIDIQLRWQDQRGAAMLFEPRSVLPIPLPGAILELKFNRLMPEWMRRVVRDFDLRQESISKYAHCVDAAVFSHIEMVV